MIILKINVYYVREIVLHTTNNLFENYVLILQTSF